MYGRVVLLSRAAGSSDHVLSPRLLLLPSVLPERGRLQVVSVGLQHAGVVAAQVLAVGGVAHGQLVVVAELEEEVDGRVAAAHHRLLVAHHPVFTCGVWRRGRK